MLKLVLDNPKTKKMCKHAVNKLSFVTRYISHEYEIQECSVKLS